MLNWLPYAILSAFFASLVTIFTKIGLKNVDSNLATAIRTVVVLVMAWGIVFLTGAQKGLGKIDRTSLIFLIISGLATGASWLFYFKALQKGDATPVAAVDKLSLAFTLVLSFMILHEPFSVKTVLACVLVTAGTLVLVF